MAQATMAKETAAVQQILNKQVANWGIMYVKLHSFHWYVKGASFFELHRLFEQLYTEAATHLDVIAERMLALGGKPAATVKEYLQLSSIQEAAGSENAEQMVKATIGDFETMIHELSEGSVKAEQENDKPTADMLSVIQEGLQKHIWMMKALIG